MSSNGTVVAVLRGCLYISLEHSLIGPDATLPEDMAALSLRSQDSTVARFMDSAGGEFNPYLSFLLTKQTQLPV